MLSHWSRHGNDNRDKKPLKPLKPPPSSLELLLIIELGQPIQQTEFSYSEFGQLLFQLLPLATHRFEFVKKLFPQLRGLCARPLLTFEVLLCGAYDLAHTTLRIISFITYVWDWTNTFVGMIGNNVAVSARLHAVSWIVSREEGFVAS